MINDDGGTAVVGDFALFADGTPVTSGVATALLPGTYTASETNLPGYTASSWSGDCTANGTVELDVGEDLVCRITNDDLPSDTPTLTLIKTVINDHGGTKGVGDFALFADGTPVTSGVATALLPGTYTASETNLPGYTASSWSGDCTANGTVELDVGEDPVCRITNDDDVVPTTVEIDIKPGSYPNSINLRSRGVIAVAILTTSTAEGDPLDFDAQDVDPSTVGFGPSGASIIHGIGHLADVDGDGDVDVILHFRTRDTRIVCGSTEVTLTGETFGGQPIDGTDSIKTVGCKYSSIE